MHGGVVGHSQVVDRVFVQVVRPRAAFIPELLKSATDMGVTLNHYYSSC
jgi:hypothetical protein